MPELRSSNEIREKALRRCREAGMRRTRALSAVLDFLLATGRPVTFAELCGVEPITGICDQATVYRLLVRLESAGIIRRLGLHQRAAYYVIRFPGQHDDYLVCTECGSIRALQMQCPAEALEKEVSRKSGYAEVYHELEFFGICPQCR